jgi:hypothetical protein
VSVKGSARIAEARLRRSRRQPVFFGNAEAGN